MAPPAATSPIAPPAPVPATDSRPTALAEIRVAIRQGEWDQAEALIQTG